MKGTQRLQKILYLIIAILGIYILYKGGRIVLESSGAQQALDSGRLQQALEEGAVRTWAPGYAASVEEKTDGNWIAGWMSQAAPVYSYLADGKNAGEEAAEEEMAEETGDRTANTTAGEGASGAEGASGTQKVAGAETASGAQEGASGVEGASGAQENAGAEGMQGVSGVEGYSGMQEASETGEQGASGEEDVSGVQEAASGMQKNTGETSPHQEMETKSEISQASSMNIVSDTLLEQLKDFDYLLANYYTVDAGTSADAQLLDADTLLEEDLRIDKNPKEPQILIYHTHSQEAFIDSEEDSIEDSIVGMGAVLAQELRDTYGYQVIHDTGVYDLVDGVLDRSAAYDYARQSVQQILAENPAIEVVIDLHRDGVDGQKFVTQIDGRPTSMVMFFNGISRDSNAQPLYWLENPYIQQNLAFSLQMQLAAQRLYPGFTRNIYLKAERFNLHLRPRSLLIEAGTQLNTVEEEKNAMLVLAELLNCVLGGA